MKIKKIPRKTISRTISYIRTLEDLIKASRALVSSAELAELTGVSDVQVRKDISNFGRVGTPRVGYDTKELKNTLEKFILYKDVLNIAVFGAGNLGTALMRYPGFGKGILKIIAAFDRDKKKIGNKINGVNIFSLEKAKGTIKKLKIDLGVIAVPGEHSQEVADTMVASGIKAIVNFSPLSIHVPDDVWIRDIDLSLEFLSIYCETQLAQAR